LVRPLAEYEILLDLKHPEPSGEGQGGPETAAAVEDPPRPLPGFAHHDVAEPEFAPGPRHELFVEPHRDVRSLHEPVVPILADEGDALPGGPAPTQDRVSLARGSHQEAVAGGNHRDGALLDGGDLTRRDRIPPSAPDRR